MDRLWELIETPNDIRLWALMAAVRRNVSRDEIAARSGVDPFFLHKLERIVAMERRLLGERLSPALLWEAKRLGFSDSQIATLADELPEQVRARRREWDLRPVYKMVDTCAAEFEAVTPYFYGSYEQENEAEPLTGRKAAILGSGPIRIGQGIEFDYCSVRAASALESSGYQSILINSNPETVSTDFDASSRLYFEPLDSESVLDILENESETAQAEDTPVVFQFGGQTAVNLAEPLARGGADLLGGGSRSVDLAEDRRLFEDLVVRLAIPQPPGAAIRTVDQALQTAHLIGYPVLVRPSFVLGGWAMEIVHNDEDLISYVGSANDIAGGRRSWWTSTWKAARSRSTPSATATTS